MDKRCPPSSSILYVGVGGPKASFATMCLGHGGQHAILQTAPIQTQHAQQPHPLPSPSTSYSSMSCSEYSMMLKDKTENPQPKQTRCCSCESCDIWSFKLFAQLRHGEAEANPDTIHHIQMPNTWFVLLHCHLYLANLIRCHAEQVHVRQATNAPLLMDLIGVAPFFVLQLYFGSNQECNICCTNDHI
eukprot:m.171203 g.171203  ORF g.171203 m.171203 type:complete len:188 (+) comp14549_c0_seq6:5162-5725(+)